MTDDQRPLCIDVLTDDELACYTLPANCHRVLVEAHRVTGFVNTPSGEAQVPAECVGRFPPGLHAASEPVVVTDDQRPTQSDIGPQRASPAGVAQINAQMKQAQAHLEDAFRVLVSPEDFEAVKAAPEELRRTDDQRRCKNCRYWERDRRYLETRYECGAPQSGNADDPAGMFVIQRETSEYSGGPVPIKTGPEFGCRFFEAKEEG